MRCISVNTVLFRALLALAAFYPARQIWQLYGFIGSNLTRASRGSGQFSNEMVGKKILVSLLEFKANPEYFYILPIFRLSVQIVVFWSNFNILEISKISEKFQGNEFIFNQSG